MGKAMLAIGAILTVAYVGFVAMMNQIKLEHGEAIEKRFERIDAKARAKDSKPQKDKVRKPKIAKAKNISKKQNKVK